MSSRVDALEQRVEQLEALLRLKEPDRYEVHLSPAQVRIWRIMRRGTVTRALIAEMLDLTDNCVSVQVRAIRQKLTPHGVTVTPMRGYGYKIDLEQDNVA